MDEYNKLCCERRLVQLQSSRVVSRINEWLKKLITVENINFIEAELEGVLSLKIKMENVQDQILNEINQINDESKRKKMESDWLNVNNYMLKIVAELKGVVANLKNSLSNANSCDSLFSTPLGNTTGTESANLSSQIKLTKIDLPKFDGDVRGL